MTIGEVHAYGRSQERWSCTAVVLPMGFKLLATKGLGRIYLNEYKYDSWATMIRLITNTLAAVLLAGCATTYQSAGLTGGHLDRKVPGGKLEQVFFSANGYTSADLARKYGLYRCAELAQSRNKPYFLLYESLTDAARNRPVPMPLVGSADNKPTASAFIRLLDTHEPGARDTRVVLEDLRTLVETGKADRS